VGWFVTIKNSFQNQRKPFDKRLVGQIRAIVGKEHCLSSKEDLICYGYDATNLSHLPDLVVFPKTVEEVSEILTLSNIRRFPVVPRGMGTGFSGGSVPVYGGVVMVTNRLNRILEVDPENLIALVEPGVITGEFQNHVEKLGLYYPPDPASCLYCTIGGNVAECAGGPRAIKYGVTKDYVLGLEVVLPTGEIMRTGTKTIKGVVGYDLTKLFVGSEGTLGVITKITLKLIPMPEDRKTMMVLFRKLEDATAAVSRIISAKIVPSTLEFMDNASIRCVEDYLHIGLPTDAGALLMIEVDGDREILSKHLNRIKQIVTQLSIHKIEVANNEEQIETLWKARRSLSPASYRIKPVKIAEDITVPRSKITTFVREAKAIADARGLKMINFGHAGDGNIHTSIMIDGRNDDERRQAEKAIEEVFDLTIRLGGTLSGEHGVGITKAPYIDLELDDPAIRMMKKMKNLFDPNNILNPGKIFTE